MDRMYYRPDTLNRDEIAQYLPDSKKCKDFKALYPEAKKQKGWTLPETPTSMQYQSWITYPTHKVCDGKDCSYDFVLPNSFFDGSDRNKRWEWEAYVDAQIRCGAKGFCPAVQDAWMCPSENTGGLVREGKNVHHFPSENFSDANGWKVSWLKILKKLREAQQQDLLLRYSEFKEKKYPFSVAFWEQLQNDMVVDSFPSFLEEHYLHRMYEPLFINVPRGRRDKQPPLLSPAKYALSRQDSTKDGRSEQISPIPRPLPHNEKKDDLSVIAGNFLSLAKPYLKPVDLNHLQKFISGTVEESATTLDLRHAFPVEYQEWLHSLDERKHKNAHRVVYFPIVWQRMDSQSPPSEMEKYLLLYPDSVFRPKELMASIASGKFEDSAFRDKIDYFSLVALLLRETCMIVYVTMLRTPSLFLQTADEILGSPIDDDLLKQYYKGNQRGLSDNVRLSISSKSASKTLKEIFSQLSPSALKAFRETKSSMFDDQMHSLENIRGEDPLYFVQDQRRVNLTAVVALNQDSDYCGHVYTWDDRQCEMMGIRTSVRNILKRIFKQHGVLFDVATILAEGVRRRCSLYCAASDQKSCKVKVVAPFGPMPAKLLKLGFYPDSRGPRPEVGKLTPYSLSNDNYMYDVKPGRFIS